MPAKPNIDRILAAGMHLREVQATNPVCCPARASWMTGRMSCEHRVIANPHPMMPGLPDMASWIHRHAGYQTVHTGKWHVPGRKPEDCYRRVLRSKGWIGEHVDAQIGRLFDAVQALPDAADTLPEGEAAKLKQARNRYWYHYHGLRRYAWAFRATKDEKRLAKAVLTAIAADKQD